MFYLAVPEYTDINVEMFIFDSKAFSKRMDKKDIDTSNEKLLDSLNLLDHGMLKRGAFLLFHHNPEKFIPGSYVKIGYCAQILWNINTDSNQGLCG